MPVIKNCLKCGKKFTVLPSRRGKFCSKNCFYQSTKVTKKCLSCSVEYSIKPIKAKTSKYCSLICKRVDFGKRFTIICGYCHHSFSVTKSLTNTKYCSKKCASLGKKDRITTQCLTCGKTFDYIKNRKNVNYCSTKCHSERNWNNGKRVCSICGDEKTIEEIAKTHKTKSGYGSRCISCQKNRDKMLRIKKKYGLSENEVSILLKTQNGRCAICQVVFEKLPFNVDHCHTNGNVRGLLCNGCNTGLGQFKDNIQNLQNAINYLLRYQRVILLHLTQ